MSRVSRIGPGETVLKRTPAAPHSRANPRVIPSSAALLVAYPIAPAT